MHAPTGRPLAAPSVATIAALCVAMAACGCAKTGPPGGGPADSTPPEVTSTVPSQGETLVDRQQAVRIEFSEEMTRKTVERAFSTTPELDLKNLRWEGRTLVAAPKAALPESSTVVVQIAANAQDYHGVEMAEPFSLAFSTGGSVDTGSIEGAVFIGEDPVPGAVVWACQERREPDEDGRLSACGLTGVTGEDGVFRIENVGASEFPYFVTAFLDENGNGIYDTMTEPGSPGETAASIGSAGATASGLVVELVTPAEE
jgi:hypothetical protein